jgi:hypothetical protein
MTQYGLMCQFWFFSTSGSFPGVEEMSRIVGQGVADTIYANFPGTWGIMNNGVVEVKTPPPTTSGSYDWTQPWHVERKTSVPSLRYYRTPQDSSYWKSVPTTWTMKVLERSDYPDNKLLVFNQDGITIWVRPEEVQTVIVPSG